MTKPWEYKTLLRDMEEAVIPQEWDGEEQKFIPYEGSKLFEELQTALTGLLEAVKAEIIGFDGNVSSGFTGVESALGDVEDKMDPIVPAINEVRDKVDCLNMDDIRSRITEVRQAIQDFETSLVPLVESIDLGTIEDELDTIKIITDVIKTQLDHHATQIKTKQDELRYVVEPIHGMIAGLSAKMDAPSDFVVGEITVSTTASAIVSEETPCVSVNVNNSVESEGDLLVGNWLSQPRRLLPGANLTIPIDDASKIYVKKEEGETVEADYIISG